MKTKIKELRKLHSLSQEELAEAVGTTRQTITSIETEKYISSLVLAHKIAKYFGLKIEEVFDFSDTEDLPMNETEKMFAGKIYNPFCEGMPEERKKAHELCQKYNQIPESNEKAREAILRKLMPEHGEGVYLQGPIQFDFGTHIKMGKRSYANFNFCVLDENTVTIGDDVFIGPNCSIFTPIHPLCHEDRNIFHDSKTDADINIEYSAPVVIENNCWLGGNVTILPGVTIEEGCVIGAGAVVSKSIPAHSLAFGNPCKVVRPITEADRTSNHPELYTD